MIQMVPLQNRVCYNIPHYAIKQHPKYAEVKSYIKKETVEKLSLE